MSLGRPYASAMTLFDDLGAPAGGSGARRVIEWLLGRSSERPGDEELADFQCFCETLIASISQGAEKSLRDWEVSEGPGAGYH